MNAIIPKSPITIRAATMADVPFIDALQKMHSKMVGWMPTKQLEGKINLGQVIVAEEKRTESGEQTQSSVLSTQSLGYAIGHDQYFKRDDVGIIYQMNVVPGKQRGLIGAMLLKAMFDRAAYGCRLYCCWCAQDIAANKFWEAMGFVPLAFRTGSERRGKNGGARVHIFWQKRIRSGDVTTPYWFPSQTTGGSIREDRLVLPIPPGTDWSDAKPLVLPGVQADAPRQLPAPAQRKRKEAVARRPANILSGGLWFAAPKAAAPEPKREPKKKVKNDPRLVAAARELRDRWLEQVNADPAVIISRGKYDVSRELAANSAAAVAALPAAIAA